VQVAGSKHQVVVGRRDVDPAGSDLLAVDGVGRAQFPAVGEDLGEIAAERSPDVQPVGPIASADK
jgi:hypothetical protein